MPESDDPGGRDAGEILPEPDRHRTVAPVSLNGAGITGLGVETDEMDVSVVEAVIMLRAGSHAAALARGREREHVEVGEIRQRIGAAVVRVMISKRAPLRHLAEDVRIHVEVAGLIFGIGAAGVGVIPHLEIQIRNAAARETRAAGGRESPRETDQEWTWRP